MYSEAELDAAVADGVISAEAVAALRDHVARARATPAADEEQFRLLTGFNDIFVSIAAILVLVAVGWLGNSLAPMLGAAAVAAVSWALAEYFTRRRRMALPSILLLVSFAGAAFFLGHLLLGANAGETVRIAAGSAVAVGAAFAHWRRFRVPITVAVGACAAVGTVLGLLVASIPGLAETALQPLLFAGGIVLFAIAMRWDMSDRTRTTRRSDVAFWLHLAAAPLVVHPSFAALGLLDGQTELWRAAIAVALYAALAIVALVVDRRALLVSALFYVLYAISALFKAAGALNVSVALTAAVVGSALLLLSAFWHATRRVALGLVPETLRRRMPVA